jgi:hypothetical protein
MRNDVKDPFANTATVPQPEVEDTKLELASNRDR